MPSSRPAGTRPVATNTRLRYHVIRLEYCRGHGRTAMVDRSSIGAIALGLALYIAPASAQAPDLSKYPDWSGQWRKIPWRGNQWDQTIPPCYHKQTPLSARRHKI